MSITAMDIQQQSFGTSRHGYDPEEVDVFLERVASEIDNLVRQNAEMGARLRAAEERVASAEQKATRTTSDGATEASIAAAFISAQRSADALREEARQEGERVYREAEAKARDIVRDALAEKQQTLSEIERLHASREKFRTEYLSMLSHFQTDAEKVLPPADPHAGDVEQALPAASQSFLRDNNASVPAQAPACEPARTSAPATAPSAETSVAKPVPGGSDFSGYGDPDDFDIEEID